MRKQTILLLAAALLVAGCNNAVKNPGSMKADLLELKRDRATLDETIKKLDSPPQVFSAPGDQLSLIRGKKGTVIFLNPGDLETEDGQMAGNNVMVELKEMTSQADFARANAQTMSNGGLLISGGAYYVNMTSGGKQLRLKKDKLLKIAFPKITDSAMMLYSGQRDSSGLMNWTPTEQALTSKNGYGVDIKDTADNKSIMVYNPRNFKLMGYVGNDSTYKRDTATLHVLKKAADSVKLADIIRQHISDSISYERQKKYIIAAKRLNENLYDITEIKKLGWVNCDRLYPNADKTNITYTISAKDSIHVAYVYLVYKELNAIVNNVFFNTTSDGTRFFEHIPIGYKARLIAIANRNNELLACKMDLTIVKDQHTLIAWKQITTQELNSYFDVNSNWGQ